MPKKKNITRRAAHGSDNSLQLFTELSAILSGEPAVTDQAAQRHMLAVRQALGVDALQAVLERFSQVKAGPDVVQRVGTELVGDPTLGPHVKSIILLWFTGVLPGPSGPIPLASQDDYFEALMWPAVGAHPPGLSDGYFGHWRYPPDEGV